MDCESQPESFRARRADLSKIRIKMKNPKLILGFIFDSYKVAFSKIMPVLSISETWLKSEPVKSASVQSAFQKIAPLIFIRINFRVEHAVSNLRS